MIETFLFDMGNVLVHFSHERMCRQIAEVCGIPSAEVRRLLFESGRQVETECGRMSEHEFHAWLEQHVGRRLDFETLRRAASDIFERHAAIEPVIETLQSRGHRLVLLSNTNQAHFRHVRQRFPVLERFDAYVLSCEVGAMKPDAAIFEAALAAAGSPPERCFYTDDIADYVAAGRRFGLQAEVFTSAESLCEQLRQRGIDLPPTGAP